MKTIDLNAVFEVLPDDPRLQLETLERAVLQVLTHEYPARWRERLEAITHSIREKLEAHPPHVWEV